MPIALIRRIIKNMGVDAPNARHIVGFDVVDDIAKRVEAFLYGEYEFVMDRAYSFCHFSSFGHVEVSLLQPYAKRT